MSLQDFAIAVAEALKEKEIDVILTGGAVVSIYSEGKYVSKDVPILGASFEYKSNFTTSRRFGVLASSEKSKINSGK